jgi:hypothetical protein
MFFQPLRDPSILFAWRSLLGFLQWSFETQADSVSDSHIRSVANAHIVQSSPGFAATAQKVILIKA